MSNKTKRPCIGVKIYRKAPALFFDTIYTPRSLTLTILKYRRSYLLKHKLKS